MKRTGMLMVAALAGTIAPAWAEPAPRAEDRTIEIVTTEDGRRYEIIVRDDEVDARVDGLRIAPDRVRREENRVIILDEDGNTLKSVAIAPRAGRSGWIGSDDGMTWAFAGEAERPPVMLGVLLGSPSEALQAQLGVSEHAVLIETVLDGLPAERAGLERWDILVEVDGERLDEPGELREILMGSEPGDELGVVLIREAAEHELTIELEAYDGEALGRAESRRLAPMAPQGPEWEGMGGDWAQNWARQWGDRGMEAARRALEQARRQLESEHGRAQMEEAERALEEAIRQLQQRGPGGRTPWRFDDEGRLVRPDDGENTVVRLRR